MRARQAGGAGGVTRGRCVGGHSAAASPLRFTELVDRAKGAAHRGHHRSIIFGVREELDVVRGDCRGELAQRFVEGGRIRLFAACFRDPERLAVDLVGEAPR